MSLALLIDLGSTFTKVVIANPERETIVAESKAVTTATTDIMDGLRKSLDQIPQFSELSSYGFDHKLACSSAKGGLKVIAVGLVPELTAEAARRASLGAGAKVLAAFSYGLTIRELREIEDLEPDIVLLSGGIDGGDTKVILHNARVLAGSTLQVPVIVAGNKEARDDVAGVLRSSGKEVRETENVMPELGELNIEPAREMIREVFLERIVRAKGLSQVEDLVHILLPTPSATLKASELLADGTEAESGLGDLMVVEVGGATTNIHSVSEGNPTHSRTILRGLPEPYAKRTVEGDMGLRVSVDSLLKVCGASKILEMTGLGISEDELKDRIAELSLNVGRVPRTREDYQIDQALARVAVDVAVTRHVGKLREMFSPSGSFLIQEGKDLSNIGSVIGTGGPIVHSWNPRRILEEACSRGDNPLLLKPKRPRLFVDEEYIMWAMGLLSFAAPDSSLRMMKKYLREL